MIYKTLNKELKNDELEYHYNPMVNSGDSDGLTFLDYIYCFL